MRNFKDKSNSQSQIKNPKKRTIISISSLLYKRDLEAREISWDKIIPLRNIQEKNRNNYVIVLSNQKKKHQKVKSKKNRTNHK